MVVVAGLNEGKLRRLISHHLDDSATHLQKYLALLAGFSSYRANFSRIAFASV